MLKVKDKYTDDIFVVHGTQEITSHDTEDDGYGGTYSTTTYTTEFLIYNYSGWTWVDAKHYEPSE